MWNPLENLMGTSWLPIGNINQNLVKNQNLPPFPKGKGSGHLACLRPCLIGCREFMFVIVLVTHFLPTPILSSEGWISSGGYWSRPSNLAQNCTWCRTVAGTELARGYLAALDNGYYQGKGTASFPSYPQNSEKNQGIAWWNCKKSWRCSLWMPCQT